MAARVSSTSSEEMVSSSEDSASEDPINIAKGRGADLKEPENLCRLRCRVPQSATLYGLPKLHKPNIPMRPIEGLNGVNRQPSTVNRQPSTVNRQPSTGPKINRQPSKKEYFYRQMSKPKLAVKFLRYP
ncbi:hypothetical protein P5673_008414 [Acropora cervicornis]|uniref:Uncharacterized protein n=1 Tax=Acropora cervicornis TaxID=6130 RepID=A0AAD9QUY9_ACRCE|nr:hypothetical protein P5673_008414 [Acropora cervicornis]